MLSKMPFDQLPAEIRQRIASYSELHDLFTLARVSRSWRSFIHSHAVRLPKYEISSLRIEQFDYVRFKFKANAVRVRDNKATQIKIYYFRTTNDLDLFLKFIRVKKSLYIRLSSEINLQESICKACKEIDTITFVPDSRQRTEGQCVGINYLSQISAGLPNINNFMLEDMSDCCNEDAYKIFTTVKDPLFIEVRSGISNSKLRITDETLRHLTSLNQEMDCIVLSTDCTQFSLKAVREFLTNAQFRDNGLLELFYIDCTTNDFFQLLSNMRISFESEPVRGIYNSFPINLRGKRVCLNIKYLRTQHDKPNR
ncbi:hypothetical protein M3Y97_00052900 [Aphelenchoides bicaudatus]|nr:hypothetical protein M3Y97_00052900 [Aphelenchoides bicaudatus]